MGQDATEKGARSTGVEEKAPRDEAKKAVKPEGGDAEKETRGAASQKPGDKGESKGMKKGTRIALIACMIVLIGVAVTGFAYLGSINSQLKQIESLESEGEEPIVPAESDGDELADNPIDFASLVEENPDVYAWISIPNTNVNYPILQSSIDDLFYFDHASDGSENVYGAIFTQRANAKDFTDPVTMVYGHRSHGTGVLFSTLHNFEDPTFFEENSTFYIYTPGHILTYEIVSAYQYDNRHVLNTFDFSDPAVLQSYYDYVCNPDSLVKNVREGVTLTTDDKIVQLSTCMADWEETQRYIVTGVLIDDQATN